MVAQRLRGGCEGCGCGDLPVLGSLRLEEVVELGRQGIV